MTDKQKREHASRLSKLCILYDCAARESAEADEGVKAAQRIKERADRLRLEAKQKLADEEVWPDIERMPEALRSRFYSAFPSLGGLTKDELSALALRGIVKKHKDRSRYVYARSRAQRRLQRHAEGSADRRCAPPRPEGRVRRE